MTQTDNMFENCVIAMHIHCSTETLNHRPLNNFQPEADTATSFTSLFTKQLTTKDTPPYDSNNETTTCTLATTESLTLPRKIIQKPKRKQRQR